MTVDMNHSLWVKAWWCKNSFYRSEAELRAELIFELKRLDGVDAGEGSERPAFNVKNNFTY